MDLNSYQQAVTDFLNGQEFFNDAAGGVLAKPIHALSENLGDVANRIQLALAKLGICAIVTTPEGACEQPNIQPPVINPELVVTVIENVIVNRGSAGTGVKAGELANAIGFFLHLETTLGMPILKGVFLSKARLPAGRIGYDVTFKAPYVTLARPLRRDVAGTEDGGIEGNEDGSIAGTEG